ncbi:cysteine-rich CWC family protein [Adhaeribacter soli]|uniref:Cysteine-rich CWC family protein n=1 Tax=Adhaeribacter soli TaxID=2607655 RepID=A0A5N1IPI7_9BACT|nr:cysteine-rich CWC family protein [Adhaeribacter soli]KAA9325390.1 hypothetical protein F0P94_17525 [Adhaeribacter soli]
MKDENAKSTISCFQCGAELICGAVNGDATCWCDSLPNIMPLNQEAASCYCQTCLEKELQKKRSEN